MLARKNEFFVWANVKDKKMVELRSRLTLGNIKNGPLGPDFSYGSPGQAKLLQKQKLSIAASLGIK